MIAEQVELQGRVDQPVMLTGAHGIHQAMFPPIEQLDFTKATEVRALKQQLKPVQILRMLNALTGQSAQFSGDPQQQILVSPEVADALRSLGSVLLDVSSLKSRVVMPGAGDEIQNFARGVLTAKLSGQPLSFYVPCCPDWSRDKDGRYDYKSLGGGPSAIADKFFEEGPSVLASFVRHGIPYEGTMVIADWGLENAIQAYDVSGPRLEPEEVQKRFVATAVNTEVQLAALQDTVTSARLFHPFRVVMMTTFFAEQGIDAQATFEEARAMFVTNGRAAKLVNELHTASFPINKERRGLTEEQNRAQAIQGLAEYATFSSALPNGAILFAAESQTTSKGYNTLRQEKVPVFFVKGVSKQAQAVNIL